MPRIAFAYAARISKQEIIRWSLLVGVGLPVTAFISMAMLSCSQGSWLFGAIVVIGYLGTLAFCAAAYFRRELIPASVAFYMLFVFGVILSYRLANPPLSVLFMNCPPIETGR